MLQAERLVNEKAAAEKLGLSVRTMQGWRIRGDGPCFVRLGRRVAYRTSDLEQFIERNTYFNTSEVTK